MKRSIQRNTNNRYERKNGYKKNPIKNHTERKRIERETRDMMNECCYSTNLTSSFIPS